MVSILDTVPVPEIIRVRGVDLPVNGLGLEELAAMIAKFPEVAGFFADGVSPASFMSASPDLVAMIVCAAIRDDGPEQRAVFKSWPAGDQIKALNAVLRGTMPDGPDPFLELLGLVEKYMPIVTEKRTKGRSTSSGKPPRAS